MCRRVSCMEPVVAAILAHQEQSRQLSRALFLWRIAAVERSREKMRLGFVFHKLRQDIGHRISELQEAEMYIDESNPAVLFALAECYTWMDYPDFLALSQEDLCPHTKSWLNRVRPDITRMAARMLVINEHD